MDEGDSWKKLFLQKGFFFGCFKKKIHIYIYILILTFSDKKKKKTLQYCDFCAEMLKDLKAYLQRHSCALMYSERDKEKKARKT